MLDAMFGAIAAALTLACSASEAANEHGFTISSQCDGDEVSIVLTGPDRQPEMLARGAAIDPRSVRIGDHQAYWKESGRWREASFADAEPASVSPPGVSRAGAAELGSYRLRRRRLEVVYGTGGGTTLLEVVARRRRPSLLLEVVTSTTYDDSLSVRCVSVPVRRRGLRRVVEYGGGRVLRPVARAGRQERRELRGLCRDAQPAPAVVRRPPSP